MFGKHTRRIGGDGRSLPQWLHTLALTAALLAGLLAFPLASRAAPATGESAPDFALKSTGGENLRLSEYRGDVVVLTFWASWCGECRQTLATLNGVAGSGGDQAPVVLGVNLDGDSARAASVAQSVGCRFPTLVDSRQKVGRLYGLDRLPLTIVLDREGVVRGSWERDSVPPAALNALLKELARL
jgi:peroxiredoxin